MSSLRIQPGIGDNVQVYWPEDKAYYTGEVVAHNRSSNKFAVAYDDGDMEELNFGEEIWRFVPKNTISNHTSLPPSPVDIMGTHAQFAPEVPKKSKHSPLTRKMLARAVWIWLKDAKDSTSAHCILRLTLDTLYNAVCDEKVLRKILLDPTLDETWLDEPNEEAGKGRILFEIMKILEFAMDKIPVPPKDSLKKPVLIVCSILLQAIHHSKNGNL